MCGPVFRPATTLVLAFFCAGCINFQRPAEKQLFETATKDYTQVGTFRFYFNQNGDRTFVIKQKEGNDFREVFSERAPGAEDEYYVAPNGDPGIAASDHHFLARVGGRGVQAVAVLRKHDGGSYETLLFKLTPDFEPIGRIESGAAPLTFARVRRTGLDELVGHDVFTQWGAEGPAPQVILRYHEGEFVLDIQAMQRPVPSQMQEGAMEAAIKAQFDDLPPQDPRRPVTWAPASLATAMADQIYCGNAGASRIIFDDCWPKRKRGKEEWFAWFIQQLQKSRFVVVRNWGD